MQTPAFSAVELVALPADVLAQIKYSKQVRAAIYGDAITSVGIPLYEDFAARTRAELAIYGAVHSAASAVSASIPGSSVEAR